MLQANEVRQDLHRAWPLSRRSVLLGTLTSLVAGGLTWRSEANSGPKLSIGLCPPRYYNGFSPFLNWWKQSAPLQIELRSGQRLSGADVWAGGQFLDAETGELKRPAAPEIAAISRVFFANTGAFQQNAGCDYSGEQFVLVWEGEAEVHVDYLTAGAKQEAGENRIEFTMGTNPGNTAVRFVLTDGDNPPRNIRIYQKRYAESVSAGEIFNPDWIDVVRDFRTVRCMDWQAINGSAITDFSQLADLNYLSWGQPLSANENDNGPKGAVHPELLCRLANRANVDLHVCIPHRASDDFVEHLASYFRRNTTAVVTFEFSNECWNFAFGQCVELMQNGQSRWPDDAERGYRYYGYRAAECMSIISRVYDGERRWRGALATQTVNAGVTRAMMSGVRSWIKDHPRHPRPMTPASLFEGLFVTGYFGDVTSCTKPDAITKSNPAVITSPLHGYATGASVRFFFASGMKQLDQRDATVRKIDDNTYAIDIDSSGFDDFESSAKNYVAPSAIFQLMDVSRAKHLENPSGFSTPYAFFNQAMSQSLLMGDTDSGVLTEVSVASLRDRYWPEQLALAKSAGLSLRQYEGGCHLVGDAYLNGYGGNTKYTEYVTQFSYSDEIARVYKAMYDSFLAVGGKTPSKYVVDGAVSQYGCWAGIRYWPTAANRNSTDTENPVWAVTVEANASGNPGR